MIEDQGDKVNLKWFPEHYSIPLWPIIKLHVLALLESRIIPINFWAKRSKVKGTVKTFSSHNSLWRMKRECCYGIKTFSRPKLHSRSTLHKLHTDTLESRMRCIDFVSNVKITGNSLLRKVSGLYLHLIYTFLNDLQETHSLLHETHSLLHETQFPYMKLTHYYMKLTHSYMKLNHSYMKLTPT